MCLGFESVVDVWMFLMGETDVYTQCCCADCSTKRVPSVPEHQGRNTELSIHSVSGQWAAEWLSSPGSSVPGAAEPYWLPTQIKQRLLLLVNILNSLNLLFCLFLHL